jgi:hypothetical protein
MIAAARRQTGAAAGGGAVIVFQQGEAPDISGAVAGSVNVATY